MRSASFAGVGCALPLRNQWFADCLLEGDGFEPSVPREEEPTRRDGFVRPFPHFPSETDRGFASVSLQRGDANLTFGGASARHPHAPRSRLSETGALSGCHGWLPLQWL